MIDTISKHELERASKIEGYLAVFREVYDGKSMAQIARERNDVVQNIDNTLKTFIRLYLFERCDPFFVDVHPEAVNVRPGWGITKLVHEHRSLYLDLTRRFQNMEILVMSR